MRTTPPTSTANYDNNEIRKKSPEFITDHDARISYPDSALEYGGISTHHVRVANNTDIIVESRTLYEENFSSIVLTGNALVDEDEVYVVVVGAPKTENFRG